MARPLARETSSTHRLHRVLAGPVPKSSGGGASRSFHHRASGSITARASHHAVGPRREAEHPRLHLQAGSPMRLGHSQRPHPRHAVSRPENRSIRRTGHPRHPQDSQHGRLLARTALDPRAQNTGAPQDSQHGHLLARTARVDRCDRRPVGLAARAPAGPYRSREPVPPAPRRTRSTGALRPVPLA